MPTIRRKFRKLGQQIDELCYEKQILKRDIADMMQYTPSYLSQLIARGGTAKQIEDLAAALNLDPFHFDRYHVLTLLDRVEGGDELARKFVFLMIDAQHSLARKQK